MLHPYLKLMKMPQKYTHIPHMALIPAKLINFRILKLFFSLRYVQLLIKFTYLSPKISKVVYCLKNNIHIIRFPDLSYYLNYIDSAAHPSRWEINGLSARHHKHFVRLNPPRSPAHHQPPK